MRCIPLSDSAILLQLGDQPDPLANHQVHRLSAALSAASHPGILEMVPGYASLVVHYDPLLLTQTQVINWLSDHHAAAREGAARPPRRVEVPVRYDGPDLPDVAALLGLSLQDVIRQHSDVEYTVYMMGFSPGFAYLGVLSFALPVPRLATPRTRVPAGSVAVAGTQTGIYPVDSPGGWRILGHTNLRPFDLRREPPFLLAPGDRVRFVVEPDLP